MIHRWRALSIISVGIIKLCTKISLALVSSSILRRPAICLQSCRLSVSTTGTSTMVTGTSTMVTGTRKSQTVLLPSGRFVGCWPVGLGQYNGGAAVFLAKERRILNPREEVLPIPITEDAVSLLSEAMQPREVPLGVLLRTCAPLFSRDGGMYDNIPWDWSGDDMAKREAFQRSQGKGMMANLPGMGEESAGQQTFRSVYGFLADIATSLCPIDILNLFVEEEETLAGGVTLGASAYLRRRPDAEDGGGQKNVIEVTSDEAVGVAMSLGRQIYVSEDIWEGGRVRPNFIMNDDKMRLDLNIKGDDMFADSGREMPPEQPPAWTIKSRGALSRMTPEEKRNSLRASGVRPPRKRVLSESENQNKDLEDLMLPLMDEAVRRDVLLARAWRQGDFTRAGELCAGKSERHIVAEQLQLAMKDNDQELAGILMERLEILESCRMDPSLDVDSYQKDLDADEWYLRNRRASRG